MRGQLSLEFLLILLIFSSVFLIILSNIDQIKKTGDYAINLRNAELILDRIYHSCERVYISGPDSEEVLVLYSLTNYSLNSSNRSVSIMFDSFNGTRVVKRDTKFPCRPNITLGEGINSLLVSYSGFTLIPNSNFSG